MSYIFYYIIVFKGWAVLEGMVYVDKKEQRCEVQYCVILREGNNARLKHYVWASGEQIRHVFDSCGFDDTTIPVIIEMGHIVGQGKGEISDKASFNKNNLASLVFECQNEKTTNKCTEYWRVLIAFPNHK